MAQHMIRGGSVLVGAGTAPGFAEIAEPVFVRLEELCGETLHVITVVPYKQFEATAKLRQRNAKLEETVQQLAGLLDQHGLLDQALGIANDLATIRAALPRPE